MLLISSRLTKYSYFVKISDPTLMLPEQLAQNITSMLLVDLKDLQLSHTSEQGKPTEYSKVALNGLGLKFQTLETVGSKWKVLQSSTVLQPVSFALELAKKSKAASGNPFLHVSCTLDNFVARISLKRFQASLAILQGFVSQTMASPAEDDDDQKDKQDQEQENAKARQVIEEGAVSADTTALIETKPKFVDMIAQFHIKHLNMCVLSDYEAELELFYIYFKVCKTKFCVLIFSGCDW